MPSIKLGELLVEANVLRESQLRAALNEQKKRGGLLGDILMAMSLVTEDLLMRALSRQLGVPVANLETVQGVAAKVLAKLPKEEARKLQTVPLQLKDNGKTLIVAMAEPHNLEQLDALRQVTGCRILAQLAPRSALTRAFERLYGSTESPKDAEALPESSAEDLGTGEPALPGTEALARALEEVQRADAAMLRATVELLIEKGVFTEAEYLAKVRRP